jgi:UDP-glucose 4-epimerase
VYGTDFSTVDGSGVRDYVHVADIADAHVRTAQGLAGGELRGEMLNVGRGEGASVLEMVRAVRQATGHDLEYVAVPRRVGDPAAVVASAERIASRLGWHATRDLKDIVTSAWAAHRWSGSADALLAVGR